MESVGYWEAWQLWFAGERVADLDLLWWKILWWGRWGKVLGVASAFLLIVEIIGIERLERTGRTIRNRPRWERFLFVPSFRYYRFVNSRFRKVRSHVNKISIRANAKILILASSIVDPKSGGSRELAFQAITFIPRMATSQLTTMAMMFLVNMPRRGLLSIVEMPTEMVRYSVLTITNPIDMVGRALDRPNLGVILRIFTALSILVGFHFDLLAS